MKTRGDFLRAQRGLRQGTAGMSVETCATHGKSARPDLVRFGVTATRKIGGAVERNRAKRRLREAARATLPTRGRAMRDYVLVARAATPTRDFRALLGDLAQALSALHIAVDRARENAGDIRR